MAVSANGAAPSGKALQTATNRRENRRIENEARLLVNQRRQEQIPAAYCSLKRILPNDALQP